MTGHILLTGLVTGYDAKTRRLCTALCTVPPSHPAIPSVNGDYVYVRCVLSATYVLCNRALGFTTLVVLFLWTAVNVADPIMTPIQASVQIQKGVWFLWQHSVRLTGWLPPNTKQHNTAVPSSRGSLEHSSWETSSL